MNLNRILGITATSLVILITAVTGISLTLRKQSEAVSYDQSVFKSSLKKSENTFTKLGQIRTSSKPDSKGKSSVIIITPFLEYTGGDQAFYEELDSKQTKIKKIITECISSRTTQELNQKGEKALTEEMLNKINAVLVLQKIQNIYFTDFQFL